MRIKKGHSPADSGIKRYAKLNKKAKGAWEKCRRLGKKGLLIYHQGRKGLEKENQFFI